MKCTGINASACCLAREVAKERKDGETLVTASVSQTPSYLSGEGKSRVQEIFKKQFDAFVENGVDFVICEVAFLSIFPDKFLKLSIQ